MKIRSHLLFLVLGTLLPILAFSAAMTAVFWREQRQALEQRFVDRVRGMTIALDREIDGNIRSLQMLAESPHLQTNDLLSFHEQIMRARSTQSTWANIILSDPISGRQVINLRYPFGQPLPETLMSSPTLGHHPPASRSRSFSSTVQSRVGLCIRLGSACALSATCAAPIGWKAAASAIGVRRNRSILS